MGTENRERPAGHHGDDGNPLRQRLRSCSVPVRLGILRTVAFSDSVPSKSVNTPVRDGSPPEVEGFTLVHVESSEHMRRALVILTMLLARRPLSERSSLCLERGPPAPPTTKSRAEPKEIQRLEEHRLATLRIEPRSRGPSSSFAPKPTRRSRLSFAPGRGSVNLEGVRGVPVDRSGQAELASLVGQLDPPLP